jgi:tetratricopeptide (TPR) repeat protein
MLNLEKSYTYDFTKLLPVFLYADKNQIASIGPEMDRSIKKATKLISMHSITVKPEMDPEKEISQKDREFLSKREYNKYVDDAYLLMGKAHFYKMEYSQAKETFNYLITNFEEEFTVYEAKLWQARLAIEDSRYREAEDILTSLSKIMNFPKNIQGELDATWADFYIKNGNYEEAIVQLKNAIENTHTKSVKTRFNYILAQLYSKSNQNFMASEYYNKVIRMNPPYEMTFNAKINRALTFQVGAGSKKDIEKQLNKMLRDDKNIDYQDQIYYALGNLYYKANDIDKAIEYYKLSSYASVDNKIQKAITNLTLADLYYDRPDYVNAQAYYDSAVGIITPEYPDYEMIYTKSISLTNLVSDINTVHFEDSVLTLSLMPRNELNDLIAELIEQKLQADEENRLREMELAEQRFNSTSDEILRQTGSGNSFYFYNNSAKSIGHKEFISIWGNRKLEDNWRRKNKNTVTFAEAEIGKEEPEISTEQTTAVKIITDSKSPEFYLQYIPFSDSAKTISHEKIAKSLHSMGDIYTEDLKDYPRAIESYEELLRRYPLYENRLLVYYSLYNVSKELQDKNRLGIYQQKIIREFPNSNYAKLMTNPNYVQELLDAQKAVYDYYEQTYTLFMNRNYLQAATRSKKAMDDYPNHELYPKFDYMYTISAGVRKDTLSFVMDIQAFIDRYPVSDLTKNAELLIAYLQSEEPQIIEQQNIEIARKLFTPGLDEPHFFAFVTPKNLNYSQLIFNIFSFNLDNFDELKLEVKRVDVGNDRSLCLVQRFADGDQAINYLRRIMVDRNIFKDIDSRGIESIVISETNYRTLTETGKINQYLLFFNENYR